MKTILRYYLINLASLWVTTHVVSGLTYSGGLRTLFFGGLVFTVINFFLVPLLKILLLPLNILTLGLLSWITNVLALFALTKLVSAFSLKPYFFKGFDINVISLQPLELNVFWTAILASFCIGIITHFLQWLNH